MLFELEGERLGKLINVWVNAIRWLGEPAYYLAFPIPGHLTVAKAFLWESRKACSERRQGQESKAGGSPLAGVFANKCGPFGVTSRTPAALNLSTGPGLSERALSGIRQGSQRPPSGMDAPESAKSLFRCCSQREA